MCKKCVDNCIECENIYECKLCSSDICLIYSNPLRQFLSVLISYFSCQQCAIDYIEVIELMNVTEIYKEFDFLYSNLSEYAL